MLLFENFILLVILVIYFYCGPPEIANDLYSQLQTLRQSACIPETENNNVDLFDVAVSEIINIVVSYDMGWSKRGNGRNYDSLNGYATLIGFLSGKIIAYTTRNRKYALCDKRHHKSDHDCRKNYAGSAKAMEADAGVELINRSQILRDANVNVRVVIGDEDSSTIATVRKQRSDEVYKLCDRNHLIKNFGKDLYVLAKTCKELNRQGVITHIKKCFSYAISQNKGQSLELAKAILNIPEHLFNQHENCGNWCKSQDNKKKPTVILNNEDLYNKLSQLFQSYANNARKFSVAASTQANESVNNVIAHKAPKSICYSRSASSDFRVASAVCCTNDGESSLIDIKKKIMFISWYTHC